MLKICIPQKDLKYFNEVIEKHPGSVEKTPIKGFDGGDFFEIFVEISLELLPLILTVLDVYLNYVSVKMQKKDLQASIEHKNDNDDSENGFEVVIKYGSKMIKYSNADLKKDKPHKILEKLASVLKMSIDED